MPNAIKYNVSAETLALKKGNFWIGTGDVGKGPSSSTGYYNGLTPTSGGYVIYSYNTSLTGNIGYFTVANDSELISYTNRIAGTSYTTANECLVYYAGQTDKVCVNIDYPPIVTNGLVLNLDAGFTPSYPRTNTTWYDISDNGYNGTLINGPTFDSANSGSIVFDGVDDFVNIPTNSAFNTSSVTFEVWANLQSVGYRHILYLNWQGNSLEVYSNRSVTMYNYNSQGQQGAGTVGSLFNWGDWVQFVGIYNDITQTLQTYVNGTLQGSRTSTPSTIYSVGDHKISAPNYSGAINGKVAITRHYNRALSSSEVLQNYNAQKSRFGL
jgi:hypothetical protein